MINVTVWRSLFKLSTDNETGQNVIDSIDWSIGSEGRNDDGEASNIWQRPSGLLDIYFSVFASRRRVWDNFPTRLIDHWTQHDRLSFSIDLLEEEVNFIFEFVSSYCDKQTVYDVSLSWCRFNIPGVILQMWAETLTTLPHQDETLSLVSALKITHEVCFYSSVWGVCVHWCVQWPRWWMVKLGSLWREQTRSSSPLTRIFPTVSLCSPAAEEESKSK